MAFAQDARIWMESMLRRAGLSRVPRAALACMAALCLVLVVFAAWRFWPAGAQQAGEDYSLQAQTSSFQVPLEGEADAQGAAGGSDTAGQQTLKVDVEGAVRHPGLYELPAGARVGEAVDAAGGLTKKAARAAVNLAESVQDGTLVYVPRKKEVAAGASASASTVAADSGAGSLGGVSSSAQAGVADASGQGKVNLNTASVEQLQELNGIGPVLAGNIVDYRSEHGGFASVDDLKEVSGIGDTRFAQLKDKVCV